MNDDLASRTPIREDRRHHLGGISDEARVARRCFDNRLYGDRIGALRTPGNQIPGSDSELASGDNGGPARCRHDAKQRKSRENFQTFPNSRFNSGLGYNLRTTAGPPDSARIVELQGTGVWRERDSSLGQDGLRDLSAHG
jgi:hypothetical protein